MPSAPAAWLAPSSRGRDDARRLAAAGRQSGLLLQCIALQTDTGKWFCTASDWQRAPCRYWSVLHSYIGQDLHCLGLGLVWVQPLKSHRSIPFQIVAIPEKQHSHHS